MIQIKNTEVLKSMLVYPAHPKLIELLQWVSCRYSKVVFTGMYECRDYPSTHSTLPFVRAMDIRSSIYPDPKAVEADINEHWLYDPDRPWMQCALFHNSGRGWHFHLQVHDNTIQRKKEE